MSIKKQFLKSKPECKVTFKVNSIDGVEIDSVKVIGDFNQWDTNVEPMKPLKTGGYSQTISLEKGKAFQFRYLVNDNMWINDPEADSYIENGIEASQYNCLLKLDD